MFNSKVNAKGNAISNVDVSISLAKTMADLAGYSDAEIKAGAEFYLRKTRASNPPGTFDRAGRFFAEERTEAVRTCRSPSRAYPWPEMHAARTAAHCAEIHGVPADRLIAVKRMAKAIDRILDGDRGPEAVAQAAKLLKKRIKKAEPEVTITAKSGGTRNALDNLAEQAFRMSSVHPVVFVRSERPGFVVLKGAPDDAAFVRRAQVLGGSLKDKIFWIFPEDKIAEVASVLHHVFGITVMHRPPFASRFVPVEVPSAATRRAYRL